MWERTLSLYSAGKTFSCTGWRVGYAIGPSDLIAPCIQAQSLIAFCVATPLEMATATAIEQAAENGYFMALGEMLGRKAAVLTAMLTEAGLPVVAPKGGYFLMADCSAMLDPDDPSTVRAPKHLAQFLPCVRSNHSMFKHARCQAPS
jgi:aspartate/methionine/tyrosine aminotransferase